MYRALEGSCDSGRVFYYLDWWSCLSDDYLSRLQSFLVFFGYKDRIYTGRTSKYYKNETIVLRFAMLNPWAARLKPTLWRVRLFLNWTFWRVDKLRAGPWNKIYILLETVSKNRQSIRLLLILSKINSIILVLFKVYKLNSNKSGKGYCQVTRVTISGFFFRVCVKLRFAIIMSVFANPFLLVVIFPFFPFLKGLYFWNALWHFHISSPFPTPLPPKTVSAHTPSCHIGCHFDFGLNSKSVGEANGLLWRAFVFNRV